MAAERGGGRPPVRPARVAGARPRPPTPQGAGASQLLRKITVAGVTVEVVRQNSTIIYRLPGNMPVASLTSEQRTKVMSEIQRIRSSTASPTRIAARPAAPQSLRSVPPAGTRAPTPHSRPRPSLPSLAPRPQLATGRGAGPRSAPASGSFSAPGTPPNGAVRTPGPRRTPQTPGTPQKTALEKMYQSAYLKLLGGPAEVLRRLSPPVEIGSIVEGAGPGSAVEPASLLQILKALTKAQASQLAHMYDSELRARTPADAASDFCPSLPGSQPQSGDVSPVGSYASGAERDPHDFPGSGAATPTKRRKYNKTGKYSAKNRTPTPTPRANTMSPGPPPASEAPRVRPQSRHEAEVSQRFREALAMDHHMVRAPEWQTPFSGTQDMIQRLLPFHVFQYPDSAIDAGVAREEQRIEASTPVLELRVQAFARRYDALLAREGDGGCYAPDHIQIDRQRIAALRLELEQIDDARLQRDISSVGDGLFW
ncbi:hypothetical protein H4S02_009788 [Coemansia sp. RSA 2611]|nr:hypothetical protein H4S02_009788 [Coemansia sp. RSA 2611]